MGIIVVLVNWGRNGSESLSYSMVIGGFEKSLQTNHAFLFLICMLLCWYFVLLI